MAQHAPYQPLHQRRAEAPDSWKNPNPRRDDWEERPREIAFWTIPLLLTMLAMVAVILFFSIAS
jgi:hypothetical protein